MVMTGKRAADSALDIDLCWEAVQTRDARFEGSFVYAVRSTGVYCRPTCAARRPRREGVAFFQDAARAAAAGFRACRRCRPDEARPYDAQLRMAQRVCAYIDARPDEAVTLKALSAHTGFSSYPSPRARIVL